MARKVVKKSNRAAIYVRVSTEEQAKEGFSLAAQEQALNGHAKLLGYELFKIYRDEGKSAKDMHRPAMQQMLKDAEKHYFSAIIVYKLDRFSRSLKDLILTIEKLKDIDVDFISMQDRIETASASGKLMFHIISSFAEFERDIISERTRFGMVEKAKEGGIVSKAPLGYKIVEGRLVIDPDAARKVRTMFEDYLSASKSLNQIARAHSITVRGLLKILSNRTYIGEIKFKETYAGSQEHIIDHELFDAVQARLKSESTRRLSGKHERLLKDIIPDQILMQNIIKDLISNELHLSTKVISKDDAKTSILAILEEEGFDEKEIFYNRVFVNADNPWMCALNSQKKIFIEQKDSISKARGYLEENIEVWIAHDGMLYMLSKNS